MFSFAKSFLFIDFSERQVSEKIRDIHEIIMTIDEVKEETIEIAIEIAIAIIRIEAVVQGQERACTPHPTTHTIILMRVTPHTPPTALPPCPNRTPRLWKFSAKIGNTIVEIPKKWRI